MIPVLVDPIVSREKFQREFDLWKANSKSAERGWLLLNYDNTELTIELAFIASIAMSSGSSFLPIIACGVRLTYENYDLWPPSLTFIDVVSREPQKPHVGAIVQTTGGPQNLVIDGHPTTHRPFLCLAGIREYHTHPQHTGDDWLLHRAAHEGSVSTICDRIWRLMVKNIMGLQVNMQALPLWPLRAQLQIAIAQGDVDAVLAANSPKQRAAAEQEKVA